VRENTHRLLTSLLELRSPDRFEALADGHREVELWMRILSPATKQPLKLALTRKPLRYRRLGESLNAQSALVLVVRFLPLKW
jgi:hypothetical protein